ncbi:MAG: hypothetical protein QM736_01835 [Vicinamibacterales bacterium]
MRPDGKRELDDIDPVGARFGCTLLEEELAADAVRIANEDVRAVAGSAQCAIGDGKVVAHQIELGVPRIWEEHLVRVRDRDVPSGDGDHLVLSSRHRSTIRESGNRDKGQG